MRRLVLAGKCNGAVRRIALALTSDLDQKDYRAEIAALFVFARDGIRYARDTSETEVLHTVDAILSQRAGDCDDKCILLCALLESLDHPTRLHAVGFARGQLSHVYCDVALDGQWIALDPTEPVPPGWAPPESVEHMLLENREC